MSTSDSRHSIASFASNFLAGKGSNHQRRRSGLGLFATVMFLPLLLGVMGCFELPAPIGDPEKSRIDPGMSGVWLDNSGDSDDLIWVFEPYDKRTWLVRWVMLEETGSTDNGTDEDIPSEEVDEFVGEDLTILEMYRAERLKVEGVALFKGWRKRISGQSFLTMEFRGFLSSEAGMESKVWWGASIELVDENHLALRFINNEFDEMENDMTRAQLERVIRRNIDEPQLFVSDVPAVLERVPQEDYDILAKMLDEAGVMATYD